MALSALIVRIGANTDDLNRGLVNADRIVDRFGQKAARTGRTVARFGNTATQAAASLGRLGGVLPGVTGGIGTMAVALGSASLVMGETAVLSTALSKAWRGMSAASTAVAASSAPAWLASLASPAGLAIAAVTALAAAAGALYLAFRKVETVDFSKALKILDKADELDEFRRDLALASQETVTLGIRSAPTVNVTAPMLTALDRGQIALDQWSDALKGIRPITLRVASDFADAMSAVKGALSDVSLRTREEVTQLYRMLDALKQIAAVKLPNLPSLPKVGLTPSGTQIGSPTAPTIDTGKPSRWQMFKGDIMSGLSPRDHQGNKLSMGQTVGQTLGGAGGGMVQAFAAFGPLAAILPVINGLLESLGPVLEMLLEPLVEIGRVVGDLLAPIFEMLVPVIQLIADLFLHNLAPILKAITVVISYVMEAFGWLVRGIGRLVDALPGVSAKGVINAGQAMMDAARAARKNADATDSATDAVNEFASALSNVPRVLNINALRHMVTGTPKSGGGDTGGGDTGGGGGGNDIPQKSVYTGDITIIVPGAGDPKAVANAVASALERTRARGAQSRLQVAFG